MRLNVSVLLSACAIVVLQAGCGGDGGGTAPMVYQLESETTSLSVGQDSTVDVSASVRNVTQNRVLTGAPVQFRSADYSIAVVNNDGEVTGMKGGTTDILAVFRDDTLRIPVTVRANPIDPETFRIQYSSPVSSGSTLSTDRRTVTLGSGVGFTLTSGQTSEMVVYAEDQVGDTDTARVVLCLRCTQITGNTTATQVNPSIQRRGIWTSTNTDVATVSNSASTFGRVTARAIGTAQIIFTVPGDDLADTVTVNVIQRPLTSVIIQIASFEDPRTAVANAPFAIGSRGRVQLLALPRVSSPNATANDRRVVWSMVTDNATVDALGAVTACAAVDPARGCGRVAAVGQTVTVRATAVPIPGDPTTATGTISLAVVSSN